VTLFLLDILAKSTLSSYSFFIIIKVLSSHVKSKYKHKIRYSSYIHHTKTELLLIIFRAAEIDDLSTYSMSFWSTVNGKAYTMLCVYCVSKLATAIVTGICDTASECFCQTDTQPNTTR